MGWDNSFQTIIILPSGATTGARIVLDGESGTELIYDADNELIASIAPDFATDPAGNQIYPGVTSYVAEGSVYAQMYSGSLYLGLAPDPLDPSFVPVPAQLDGGIDQLFLQSASNEVQDDPAIVVLQSGESSASTGEQTYKSVLIQGDAWMSFGTLLRTVVPTGTSTPVPEVWHVVGASQQPAYATGWAGGSTSGAYQNLQYRLDAEDNLHIVGVLHATAAGPPSTVFTLPAASGSFPSYRPPVAQRLSLDTYTTSGGDLAANAGMIINSSGIVQIFSSAAVAINQNFAVNAKVPLGNIP